MPEKFSRLAKGKLPALVSGRLYDFHSRFLFFSELIPDLNLKQLEFAVMPHWRPMNLKYLGLHSGIHEYEVYEAAD